MDRRRDRGDIVLSAGVAIALVGSLVPVFSDFTPRRGAGGGQTGATVGTVEAASGEVRRRPGGELVWERIDQGDGVYEGDAIWVAEAGAASISLEGGGRLEIAPASLVVIHLPSTSAEELLEGEAVGRTAGGSLAIRAGAEAITLEGDGAAAVTFEGPGPQVDLLTGKGRVLTAQGGASLASGERATLRMDGSLLRSPLAIALTFPAPGERLFTPAERVEVTFRWKGPEGAPVALEVARDLRFRDLAASAMTAAGEITRELAPGVYRWRLRAGPVSSEERTLLVETDRAPVPYRPRGGQEVVLPAQGPLVLEWTPAPEAGRYRLELARGEDFAHADVQEPARTFWVDRSARPNGHWCWRVRADGEGRGQSPWSSPSCFEVADHPRLRAPVLYDPTITSVTPTPPRKGKLLKKKDRP